MGNAVTNAKSDGAHLRVLVVEDELLVALELETMVEGMGHSVLGPAPSIERALDLLAREQPDIAVLDVNLRGKRVTPVAEALQRRTIPFVLVTGYEQSQLEDPILQQAPRLGKPINRGDLKVVLESKPIRLGK